VSKQEAELSLGWSTILVVSDLKGHSGSMIFIESMPLPISDV